jgi:LmbE family N-acetylglucosaminyl deacetylase
MRAADCLAAMQALPFRDLDDILAPGPVLVLAPHPDDESLGCGGLIAECCGRARPVHVAVLTDGTGSHPDSKMWPPARLKALREQEAQSAVAALGLSPDRISFLGLPDTRAPTTGAAFTAASARIAELAGMIGAQTICATWQHDPHCDHEAAASLAAAASRITGLRHLAYPVWGWTLPDDHLLPEQTIAGARLDIGRHLPAKRQAIAAHTSQTSALITDSPYGFRLSASFLSLFDRPWEAFIQT